MSSLTVAFAGLTHLGIVSAAAAAEHCDRVIGYDADATRVGDLSAGRLPIEEPGLPELISRGGERLVWTTDPAALQSADLVYVSIDVPTDAQGVSDLHPVDAILSTVMPALRDDTVLVVLCQVPPGFTRRISRPAATRYYQVETLIFGRAVERARRPERFIVGTAEPSRPLPPAYERFLSAFGCPILPMRYESAELAKTAINILLAAQVTATNTLAELCEVTGADWSEILPSLRLDARIGQHAYLAPGLGLSGGNIERDIVTLTRIAAERGTDAGLLQAFAANATYRKDWVLRALHRQVLGQEANPVVALWGLAYKVGTHSTRNAPSTALLAALPTVRFRACDPIAELPAAGFPNLERVADPIDALRGAAALVVLTPWPLFRDVEAGAIVRAMAGRVVVDPYRHLDHAALIQVGLQPSTLGVPPPDARP